MEPTRKGPSLGIGTFAQRDKRRDSWVFLSPFPVVLRSGHAMVQKSRIVVERDPDRLLILSQVHQIVILSGICCRSGLMDWAFLIEMCMA